MEVINLNTERKTFTKEDFRKVAFKDHTFFCNNLFPDAFYIGFSDTHKQMIKLITSDEKFAGVIAPRKIGKTPTICFGYLMRQILYNLESYVVIVSATVSEAERHIKKIVRTLESSEAVHYYYGNYINRKLLEVRSESVQLANGIWLRAKGLGSQIRGTAGDWTPPSMIVVDDPQSNKDVKTETSLNNASNWFDDEVIYSIAKKWQHPEFKTLHEGKIRFLGTSLHPKCLAEKLYKDKRFKFLRFSILQDEHGKSCLERGKAKSIWEEMFPTKDLFAEMELADSEGKLGNWLQERMNMPYKYGDKFFDVDDIGIWDVGENKFDIIMGNPVIVMEEDIGLKQVTAIGG